YLYFKPTLSGSKHKSSNDKGSTAKKCQSAMRKKMVDIACSYNMNCSTISMILKNKEKIKEHIKSAVLMILTVISKKSVKVMKEMEKLLGVWILMLIQEKAKSLYDDLIKGTDMVAAWEFPQILREIIDEGTYLPQQVFNVNEEKLMPGYKAFLLVYHSENPRSLKNVAKKSNLKTWVTEAIFQDWFSHCFIPEVEKYCLKDIPFSILCLLNSASGHSSFTDNFHPNVKAVHLPLKTKSLVQPVNQGKPCENFRTINTYKAIKNMDCAWHDVIAVTIYGIWKNLSPQFVHDFCGYEKQDEGSKKVFKNLLTLSEKLEVDLQEHDFIKLVSVQHEELTNEDQMELEVWRKDGEKQRGRSKVVAAVQNATHCYHVISDQIKRATTQTSLDHFSRG
ncbi:hypothetical protein FD755_025191, partial [Muntiacus reevesi]